MAQFPSVQHAVSAVQEILNNPNGPHIRMESYDPYCGRTLLKFTSIECVELLDDKSTYLHNFPEYTTNLALQQ